MGPSSVIYTSREIDPELLANIVAARASSFESDGTYSFDDTFPLGGSFKGDERPFVIGLVKFYGDHEEESQIHAFLGGQPQMVEVGALCNQDEDWIAIVDVVAWLAGEIGGCIALPDQLFRAPRSGSATVITPSDGNPYSLVDAEAFRELAKSGTPVVEK